MLTVSGTVKFLVLISDRILQFYKTYLKKSLYFTCFKNKCYYFNRVNSFEITIFSSFHVLILIYKYVKYLLNDKIQSKLKREYNTIFHFNLKQHTQFSY